MMEKRAVLVVDDEPKILELLKSYLEMNGLAALCARNGREGLALFEQNHVSLALLDLMLPDFSGEELCKKMRQVSDLPIIMITAKVDEASIIRGLNIGADDYVCKPFSPRQLMARVQAALRRSGGANSGGTGSDGTSSAGAQAGAVFSYKDLIVDTEKRLASLSGQPLSLTRDEYNILALLMSRQAKIFTRDEILEAVKGDDFDGFDRAVDTHIKKLRAKIGDDSKAPQYIVTVYGMGYRVGDHRPGIQEAANGA
ncbi:MAG: response regulator transcription factor [Treponema sp.]|jgi:DNA-binding response OmpR family regulator|nr:response regulator transcription factor [Treponema sp.]